MPINICTRCRRANPEDAVYCHHDGIALQAGAAAGLGELPKEFVFASGRRCRTFDDLVQGCQYEWEEARALLRKGGFGEFLASIGRMDLVRAAQEAQTNPDADIALYHFINALPIGHAYGPRLELAPRRLILGTLSRGEIRTVGVTVSNSGKGILQGRIKATGGGRWLTLVDAPNGAALDLKTAREQPVRVRVDTTSLVAPADYSARLTVITNGGIVELPVQLQVAPHPFPYPPFQGAGNPRGMAERIRQHPKLAVPLLEGGELAHWFAANGWDFPVKGPTARGLAAVQQFFEGMGLSKPPTVAPEATEYHFTVIPPEVVTGNIVLRTGSRKWVYAHADVDLPWLRLPSPSVSGPRKATLPFEIDSSLMDDGRTHEGQIQIIANAGQTFTIRVIVDVERPHEPLARRLMRPFL
jgi:hypothetical protein